MPTINFSLNDFQKLARKNVTLEQLKDLLPYAKSEFEKQEGDEVSVKFNDTNQPYLWSIEGLARLFRGVLGVEKGIPEIKVEKSSYEINVDKSVNEIRPFITAFIAKGKALDDYFLKQLIQLQEKICDNYGRKRQKISIGIYPSKKITFPLTYKAVKPDSLSFVPLEFTKKINLYQILEQHPKGKEYANILKDLKLYPVFMDAKEQVLSFPPIINSHEFGKLDIGDDELLFEATGTDLQSLQLATNIFAYALYERGYTLYNVTCNYSDKKIITPELKVETIKIKKEDVVELLGLLLKDSDVKSLLEKFRYNFKDYNVEIPSYRQDIMHPFDVIEDIGIMFGYDNIESLDLKTQTFGKTFPIVKFINNVRELFVGLGYQEIWSAILSNKKTLYQNTNMPDVSTVEINDFMSETYSVIRSCLLPIVLETLGENKHVDYPQKVFEEGLMAYRDGKNIIEHEHVAFASSHLNADFTETKQIVDLILRTLEIDYAVEEFDSPVFISGRAAKIMVHNKQIGYIGEIHPKVLSNLKLEMPVVAGELNLSLLFKGE